MSVFWRPGYGEARVWRVQYMLVSKFPDPTKFLLILTATDKNLFDIVLDQHKTKKGNKIAIIGRLPPCLLNLCRAWHPVSDTGSPGIGKSCFLCFIMHRLAMMDPKPVMVLEIRKHPVYCFTNNTVLSGNSPYDFTEYLVKPQTWYLVGNVHIKLAVWSWYPHPRSDADVAKHKILYEYRLTAPSPWSTRLRPYWCHCQIPPSTSERQWSSCGSWIRLPLPLLSIQ